MAGLIRHFNEIPGPRNWPVFGNILLYEFGFYSVDKYHETLFKMRDKYGDIVKENLAGRTVVHIFDPEDARKVYNNEGKIPQIIPLQDSIRMYRKMRKLNVGLGNLNGDEWYRLRKGIQQFVMKPSIASSYIGTVDETITNLIDQIRKRKTKDNYIENLNLLMSKWNLENSGRIFLEKSLGCLDEGANETKSEDAIRLNRDVFNLTAKIKFSVPIHRYVSTPQWKRLVEAEDVFMMYISDHINEAVDRMKSLISQEKLNEKYSFLQYFLSRPELNLDDVFILCLSMLVDGLSTTAPTATSMLYCLSTNPEAQEKLYKEITGILSPNEPITDDKLEKMDYLRACVKEGFRLFPSGPEVSRIIPTDLVLSNYQVPAGTAVDLNHSVLLKSKELFPNPQEFRPERWLNNTKNIHPFILTPFSHGIRSCAGRRFSAQDLFVLLCRIVQNFQLEYNPNDSPMKQVYAALLFPDRDPRIAFKDRKK